MQIFENYDGQSFKMNGKKYVKNFILMPIGEDAIAVYNAFDTKLQLLPAIHFSEVKVNNTTFQNQESLINTLSPMLFAKVVYSDGILPNQIIYLPEIARNETLLSIAAGGVWRLDGIVVGNDTPFHTLIDYAQDGFNRIDLIVAKADGTFQKIVGEESTSTANAPLIPNNSLLVTTINIFGAEIINGEPPVIGLDYIRKQHEGFFHVLALDDIQNGSITLQFSTDGANKFKIWNATSVRGFAYATSQDAQTNGWGGKSYYLINETTHPILLKHNANGIIGFIFQDAQDFVLEPKATVEFIYDGKMRYVGQSKELNVQTLSTDSPNLVFSNWYGTQAQYDALPNYHNDIMYFIE